MIIYAETVCIDCENGKIIPLEIAFATSADDVYIFQIVPERYYWLTVNDMFNTRSKMRNKDRFYNSKMRRCIPIKPIAQYKLHESVWINELLNFIHHTFPGYVEFQVRGRFQYYFFKRICGFVHVKKIYMRIGYDVMDIDHEHKIRYINYPCPGIEVRTMAYYKS